MQSPAKRYYAIFESCIARYHINDDPETIPSSLFSENSFEALLFSKCWIDTVQWHLEDIIREPGIRPDIALSVKRKIDQLNQQRTDTVEKIDDCFLNQYRNVYLKKGARHATESVGWAIDRLSILALKIYHIEVELRRIDASLDHLERCKQRKMVLDNQRADLVDAIDWLMAEIASGDKIMKVYRQLKMYNDIEFNPVLYKNCQSA